MRKPFITFHSSHGPQRGCHGDSVALTFAKSKDVHTPVMRGMCKTLTTMCDHDVGVIQLREVIP